jgi:hypothetical protein
MGRYCYCSRVLPGKVDTVRGRRASKAANKELFNEETEREFSKAVQMTRFESWLQTSPYGNFFIHCVEAESLKAVFEGIRGQIAAGNKIALNLHAFYLDVLGKDYRSPKAEPVMECVMDIALTPATPSMIKKGFVYPLLSHKEQDHRKFRKESMGPKKTRHETSLKAFGVSRLTNWIQETPEGKYIVVYTERSTNGEASELRERGRTSPEWQEIAKELVDHTGLPYEALNPEVEWLTAR